MTTAAQPGAARVAATACLGIAGFQVLLAAGAPLGRAAWGGGAAELSGVQRVASGGAALVWAGAAVTLLAFVGDLAGGRHQGSRRLRRVVVGIAAVSGLGAVLNLASSSPWERGIWAPAACATALLAGYTARSVGRSPSPVLPRRA